MNIKSNTLLSCLSLSTMTILVFASIVMITIIAVTPIIILGIGELPEGQRDIIVEPQLDYLNATRLSEVADMPVMPRCKLYLDLNGANISAWLMDFKLEK